jgi:hypothetical protein
MQNIQMLEISAQKALLAEIEMKLPYASTKRKEELKYVIDLLTNSVGKFDVMLLTHDGEGIQMMDGLEDKHIWEKGNTDMRDRRGAPIVHVDRWLLVTDPNVKDNWDHQIYVNYLSKEPFIVKIIKGDEEKVGQMFICSPEI